jgi:hypothetical protein
MDPSLLLSRDRPYLAQLAVAGHAALPDAESVAITAVDLTLDTLPKALAAEQLDAILGMVDDALRAHLEERIMEHREYRSEFFHNIPVSGTIRSRILSCTDIETLDDWIRRAAVASTAASVVRSTPKSPSRRPRRHST